MEDSIQNEHCKKKGRRTKSKDRNFSYVLWKENKEETKYQKLKVKKNKEMEMGELKQISKLEEMRECYESRQVGETEKAEGKSKEISLKDRKKE